MLGEILLGYAERREDENPTPNIATSGVVIAVLLSKTLVSLYHGGVNPYLPLPLDLPFLADANANAILARRPVLPLA